MANASPISFSVIIPTHNRPDDLAAALESLHKQTHRDFEVIVVNDGQVSVDDVVQQSPLTTDGITIRVVQTTGSLGPSAARNHGHQAATGDVIAYLDDDDIYAPEHLALHAEQYTNPEVHVVYSDANRGIIAMDGTGKDAIDIKLVHSQDFDADALMVSNYIPILCLSHRRTCLEKTGGFEESLFYLEDWDLFLRLSMHWDFIHIPQITAMYFEKQQGTSVQEENRTNFVESLDQVYMRTEGFLNQHPKRSERVLQLRLTHLGNMTFDTGMYLEQAGDLNNAASAYTRAAEYTPKPEYYMSLARVRKAQGKKAQALIAMQMAQRCAELSSD